MNTQKQAMSKIAQIQKEELSEVQRVEFALVEDINSSLKKSFDLIVLNSTFSIFKIEIRFPSINVDISFGKEYPSYFE